MRTESISGTNFQGQIIKTGKNFSTKPQQCLSDTENSINDLIKQKPFDLYIRQDYSKNEIVFETDLVGIKKTIPVTSKSSKYIETAKNIIKEHETTERTAKEEEWIERQSKAELKDALMTVLYFAALPIIFVAEAVKEETKNIKISFNKLATKLATKKG